MTTLVWFRDDLRLSDHPALAAGAADPDGIVALYVLDEVSPGARPLGGAARWWLDASLRALAADLGERGITLVLRRGAATEVVPAVAAECGAARVVWNRRYGAERHLDAEIKSGLRATGTEARSFPGGLLHEPWTVSTQAGGEYRVYTAFWRACLSLPTPGLPLSVPEELRAAAHAPVSEELGSWRLRPVAPDWSAGLAARWEPGEGAALARLDSFLTDRAERYGTRRDFPAESAGSELSPHLRWGEISPREVWHRALASGQDAGTFLSELGWREFAWHTAFHRTGDDLPGLHVRAMRPEFEAFPWLTPEADELAAWQCGETGFPLVDAGMRELWETGFMHNRVRMVTASFLTKNLLVDWRVGEAWFWDTLVDADPASNPFNWQWVAGSGADSAPYFRVFNPETQAQRFDPEGEYAERWAPDSLLRPQIVGLRESRIRALAAYDEVRARPR